MNTRPVACTVLLALAVLTAGCSGDGSDDKPTPAPTVTVTKTPRMSAAEKKTACVDAWAEVIAARPADFDPKTDEDTEPDVCAGLPGEDTDLYMKGLFKANDAAIEKGRQEIEDASRAAEQP